MASRLVLRKSLRAFSSCPPINSCPHAVPIEPPTRMPSELVDKWKNPESFEQVRKDIKYATTIPPEAFFDPGYYEAEQHQIFGKEWFCIGHTAELPRDGDTKMIEVGDTSYIVTRDKKGKFHCFYNVCRHRGARIIEDGDMKSRKRLNCPYHWWSYRLTGELVSTPFFKEDEGFRKRDYSLLKVKCDTFAGLIFITQDPNAAPLTSKFGQLKENFIDYPLQEFNILGKQTYDLNVDWKLLAENFMEWYHVGPVHPELAKFSTTDKHFMNEGPGNYVGFVTHPLTNCGGPADTTLFNPTPYSTSSDYDRETAFFYHLFPNVSITIYPHSVYTLVYFPTSPGKSRETLYLLQHPDSRIKTDTDEQFNKKAEGLMKFVCNVNDEDIWIVNRVAKGIRNSRYRGGRFSPDMERTCYRFQNMLADGMTGAQYVYPAEVTNYYRDVVEPTTVVPMELPEVFTESGEQYLNIEAVTESNQNSLEETVYKLVIETSDVAVEESSTV